MTKKSKKSRELLLPETVKIGGYDYDVIFPYDFDEAPGFTGLHNYPSGIIKVADKGRPWAKIHETLLHEIFQGLDYIYFGGTLGPGQIQKLAMGWYQLLRDNDIDWQDFEKIPKSVKVGGYTYKIDYPYRFVDRTEVTWTQTNHQRLFIRMSNGTLDEEWPARFVKQNLAFVLNTAVNNVYMEFPIEDHIADDETEYDYPPPQMLHVASMAIFQVLVDNPIEDCINNGVKIDEGG
jgi:hypothetical protein